jgi:hypothetical protein
METRKRSSNPEITCYTRATTNPGGPGHAWVKARWQISNDGRPTNFIDSRTVSGKKISVSRSFIPAKLTDNPHLGEEYEIQLLKQSDKLRRKLLDGRWDIPEGQYFTSWNPEVHIIEPFSLPLEWTRWRALDWGSARPYSVGWYCQTPDGVIYRYRELYGWGGEDNVGSRETPTQVAQKIKKIEDSEVKAGVVFRNNPADSAIWSSNGQEKTIAEEFERAGVLWSACSKGPNSRINGWTLLDQQLVEKKFLVFRTCRHFIRTFPELLHDETNPEDVDSTMEDHIGDECRYSIVSRHRMFKKGKSSSKDKRPTPGTFDDLGESKKRKSKYRF